MRQKLTQESPYLVQEWMTEKNDKEIDSVTGGSNYKAWWKCKTCDHQWKAMVTNRSNGRPSCYYRRTQQHLGKTTLIHDNPHMIPRDTALEYINMYNDQEEGRKQWKKHSSYHFRSLAETAMMRFKQTFSDKLKARTFQNQQAEVHVKSIMLNKMIQIAQANAFPKPHIDV